MVFLSKEGLLCNFKSANHVRFFQPDNTLNPEEPDLKGWLPEQEFVLDSKFGAITSPPDYSWLTAERAGECLEFAESRGYLISA